MIVHARIWPSLVGFVQVPTPFDALVSRRPLDVSGVMTQIDRARDLGQFEHPIRRGRR